MNRDCIYIYIPNQVRPGANLYLGFFNIRIDRRFLSPNRFRKIKLQFSEKCNLLFSHLIILFQECVGFSRVCVCVCVCVCVYYVHIINCLLGHTSFIYLYIYMLFCGDCAYMVYIHHVQISLLILPLEYIGASCKCSREYFFIGEKTQEISINSFFLF